ncbi:MULTISPECIES: TonB-dependent siderophore receptor [Herbaspirillum]|uniref:TonB-dependent siderophore receptor n=1 Tax=Herbaspirillum TaxID=963 RepID=UPI001F51B57B|nr:TonB-dependent receptor [Herbaspirillum sp. C7C2]MCI1013206.1 TonB-dependent receptor [Herbaspirillum sp. C7C2]
MKKTSLAAAIALIYPFATVVMAQSSNASSTPITNAVASESISDKQPVSSVLPEVVVTEESPGYAASRSSSATRTDTPLLQTPQSVSVLKRSLLDDQDVHSLSDALVNVSGVVPTKPEEALFIAPIIRGFPAETYLDGLSIFGGNQQAFNPAGLVGVERIEVLKGPSSTLYGGGLGSPLGGLINIDSTRPEIGRNGGFLGIRAGSYSTTNPYGDYNVTLSDKLAIRLAGEYQDNTSWIDKVHGKRIFFQPSILFKPDAQTEILFSGQYNRTQQLEYSGLPAQQALAGQLYRNAFPGAPNGQPMTDINNRLGKIELRHKFDDGVRLEASAQFYTSNVGEYGSFIYPALAAPDASTPTTYPIFPLTMSTRTRETALDAHLIAPMNMLGGRHEWVAGVAYDLTKFYSGMGFDGTSVGSIDLSNPQYNLAFGDKTPINSTQTDRYRTLATYVQDQAHYGRWHFTGALRLTQLEFQEAEQGTDKTYHHVSPRVGVNYDLLQGLALYAGYATAFRAPFGFIGSTIPKPETSRNIELGIKLDDKARKLSGTLAVFEQTRDNVATADPGNPLVSIQTGQQRARGFEADMTWEPVRALSLLANYAYTQAVVTQDNTIPVGDTLARVPRHSGRLAFRYRVLDGAAEGLSFGAGITALGQRQLTLPNTVSVPGMATVDAQAAYDFGQYTLQLSGYNLTGRRSYESYQYFGFPVVIPTQPRSFYLTLKVNI